MKTILLLLLMLLTSDVSGELFTALVDLEQLLHAEHQVALHLRQFVEEQRRHLSQLTMYVHLTARRHSTRHPCRCCFCTIDWLARLYFWGRKAGPKTLL